MPVVTCFREKAVFLMFFGDEFRLESIGLETKSPV